MQNTQILVGLICSMAALGTATPNALQSPVPASVQPIVLPVTVTDELGRTVTNLPQSAFQVLEDKTPQAIVSFGREDTPVSIGIIFDCSGSMGATLERSRLAVAQFLRTANPEDEAFLVEFNDHPQVAVPMTHDLQEIEHRLTEAAPTGRTALLDGIYLGLDTMKNARNARKALLVISDGLDNHSHYKANEVANLVRESDVQVYALEVSEGGRTRSAEDLSGSEMLRGLSAPTGGRHFVVENLAELPDLAAKIGIDLRHQYVIGYIPTNHVHDGKYRKVTVKLQQERGFRAFWPGGYFAPSH